MRVLAGVAGVVLIALMLSGFFVTFLLRDTARRKLERLPREYEPNAQALSEFLVLDLPPWFRHEEGRRTRLDRDLIGRS